jgi:hypothetical protein
MYLDGAPQVPFWVSKAGVTQASAGLVAVACTSARGVYHRRVVKPLMNPTTVGSSSLGQQSVVHGAEEAHWRVPERQQLSRVSVLQVSLRPHGR